MISWGGYLVCCHGGPFDGYTFNYSNLPKTLVLMTRPFIYHDYRRVGDTNDYHYVECDPIDELEREAPCENLVN